MSSDTHLKDREFYETTYDRHTVEDARDGMVHYEKFYAEFKSILDRDDTVDSPGSAILLNAFYMQTVGLELLHRYENREQYINEWMQKDEAKDTQIADARLTEEPYCQHCNKKGLRIIDKDLMRHHKDAKYDDPEEVLFTLRCPHCNKNSAFWQDGTAWFIDPERCPKCQSEVTSKTVKTKTAITFIYTCPVCSHKYKDRIDFSHKKERPDPDFEKDRVHFCLLDDEFRKHLFATKKGFEDMAELSKKFKEKEENKHIYDAIKEVKKPKIAELSSLLKISLEKAGFIEFSLDKPEMGKDVTIVFNCLDNKSERTERDSEKTLKKAIEKALIDTNWRLMSNGIHYRFGYLSGRLRAYEREEDLKKLIESSAKLKKRQPKQVEESPTGYIEAADGTKIIL